MARVHYVKRAQQRYATVPVLDENGSPMIRLLHRKDGSPKTDKRGRVITQRVTTEDRAQPLPNRTCETCRNEIKVGDPYKWVKPKSGPYGGRMRVRCGSCPTWRPSELSSSKMSEIYALQEEIDGIADGCESTDDLEVAASEAADRIRDVAEQYRESAQNIEDGFGHATYQSEELSEKADELEGWADEVEGTSFDTFDREDDWTEAGLSDDGPDAELQEEHDEWLQTQRDLLIEAVNECPV